jgi:hypothetical protein
VGVMLHSRTMVLARLLGIEYWRWAAIEKSWVLSGSHHVNGWARGGDPR